jgi:site-specific DNA-cytosine methylase
LAQKTRSRYRLIFSGEVNPIYTETLRHSLVALSCRKEGQLPQSVEAVDLRSVKTAEKIQSISETLGGVQILIGGPPCQGFSNANRNSWHSTNPHNDMVMVFVRYVEKLQPLIFLMENVQGILWTPAKGNGDPLPEALTRTACLCTGEPARIEGRRLVYSGVPPSVGAALLVAAGQPHPFLQREPLPWSLSRGQSV